MTKEQLTTDLTQVIAYFNGRGIKNYAVIFTAIDPCIGAKMARLRTLWGNPTKANAKDADLIGRLCRVVEVLKDNAGAGC